MAGIAFYPWEKKHEEHVKEHHPERLEKEQGKKDGQRRKSERRRDDDGRQESESDRSRSRRKSVSDVYMEKRNGDWEDVDRRRSVDHRRRH